MLAQAHFVQWFHETLIAISKSNSCSVACGRSKSLWAWLESFSFFINDNACFTYWFNTSYMFLQMWPVKRCWLASSGHGILQTGTCLNEATCDSEHFEHRFRNSSVQCSRVPPLRLTALRFTKSSVQMCTHVQAVTSCREDVHQSQDISFLCLSFHVSKIIYNMKGIIGRFKCTLLPAGFYLGSLGFT